MSYTTLDFSESLQRVGLAKTDIARVIAAWGYGYGQGQDEGKGWSKDSVTEWRGGFLFHLKDGRIAYLTGWCDYTGWGCQDGAHVAYYDAVPLMTSLPQDAETVPPELLDEEPADLNRWLRDSMADTTTERHQGPHGSPCAGG